MIGMAFNLVMELSSNMIAQKVITDPQWSELGGEADAIRNLDEGSLSRALCDCCNGFLGGAQQTCLWVGARSPI